MQVKNSCESKTQRVKTQNDCQADRSEIHTNRTSDMYLNNKFCARHCFVLLIMVAPVAANTNAVPVNDRAAYVKLQTEPDTSAWVTFAGLHPNTDVLVNAIAASESHGLNSDRYQLRS